MITLKVDLDERSYPIFIGRDLLEHFISDSSLIAPYISGRQVVIVSNETIAPLYLDKSLKIFSPA